MEQFNAQRHSDRIIKVCGMRDADNIADVATLTPMLMGFIFYPRSPRYAGNLAPEVIASLPGFVHPVGVFVNEDYDRITATCDRYGIKIVQLHGDETPGMCRRLRDAGYTVFKAFGVSDDTRWQDIEPYEDAADLYLFDTKTSRRGGSGRKFRWSLLDSYPLATPYLLSGGIGPEDTDAIIDAMRPKMAGIDLNSRFEVSPGVKDITRLANFIVSLRKFNEDESLTIPFWKKK